VKFNFESSDDSRQTKLPKLQGREWKPALGGAGFRTSVGFNPGAGPFKAKKIKKGFINNITQTPTNCQKPIFPAFGERFDRLASGDFAT